MKREQRDKVRRENTRKRLLDAAEQVFAEKGYHEASTSDIARRAGAGQGTFYRNFSDKRAVFEVLASRLVESLVAAVNEVELRSPTNFAEYRQASVLASRAVAHAVSRNRVLVQLILRDGPTVDREFAGYVEQMIDQFAQIATHYLQQAIARGFVTAGNTDLIGQAFVGIAMRLVHLLLRDCLPGPDIDQLVSDAIDLAFFGLGRPADGRGHPDSC